MLIQTDPDDLDAILSDSGMEVCATHSTIFDAAADTFGSTFDTITAGKPAEPNSPC